MYQNFSLRFTGAWLCCAAFLAVCGSANAQQVKGVTLSTTQVMSGNPVTATVYLTTNAPTGGSVVSLSSTNAFSSVPATLTVPAGKSSAQFTVTTEKLTVIEHSGIMAKLGTSSAEAVLYLNTMQMTLPQYPVGYSNNAFFGGTNGNGLIQFGQALLSATTIQMTSGDSHLLVAAVTAPAGATSVPFQVKTTPVTAPDQVLVTANVGVNSVHASMEVDIMNWAMPNADGQNSSRSRVPGPQSPSPLVNISSGYNWLVTSLVAGPGSSGVFFETADDGNAYDSMGDNLPLTAELNYNGWQTSLYSYSWGRYTDYYGSRTMTYEFPVTGGIALNQSGEMCLTLAEQSSDDYYTNPDNSKVYDRYTQDQATVLNMLTGAFVTEDVGSAFILPPLAYAGGEFETASSGLDEAQEKIQPAGGNYYTSGQYFWNNYFGYNILHPTQTFYASGSDSPSAGVYSYAIDSNNLTRYYWRDSLYQNGTQISIPSSQVVPIVIGTAGQTYVTTQSSLYSVSPVTNTITWTHSLPGYNQTKPCIGPDGTIYVSFIDPMGSWVVQALNPSNGSLKWQKENLGSVGCVDSLSDVYMCGPTGILYMLDVNGNTKWQVQADPSDIEDPIIASDGRMYFFGSGYSKLYVL